MTRHAGKYVSYLRVSTKRCASIVWGAAAASAASAMRNVRIKTAGGS